MTSGLVDQTVEKFYAEGIRDIGVIQANHDLTNWSRPVQIASVQTLMRCPIHNVGRTFIWEDSCAPLRLARLCYDQNRVVLY